MAQFFEYVEIESLLSANNAVMSAAEAHGTLSGMLCIELEIGYQQWFSEIFDDGNDELFEEDRKILGELFEQTRSWLGQREFDFDLVLPEEDVALSERAAALSEWSRGFLYGVGYGGEQSQWSGECNEILRDMVEISRLDPLADGEENEQAFMELTEYLRVAVQLLLSELQAAPKNKPLLH